MGNSEIINLLNGVNFIATEAMVNLEGYLKIMGMRKLKNEEPIPIALMALAKSHNHVFSIEIMKLLTPSKDNKFQLGYVLNKCIYHFHRDNSFRKPFTDLLSEYEYEIKRLKKIRDELYAHTDENFLDFVFDVKVDRLIELSTKILDIIRDLNELSTLEHYRFNTRDDVGFQLFYDLIEERIINLELPKELATDRYSF